LIYQGQFVRGFQGEPKVDLGVDRLARAKHHVTRTIRPKPETDTTVVVPRKRDPTTRGCQNVEIRHQYHLLRHSIEMCALCVLGPHLRRQLREAKTAIFSRHILPHCTSRSQPIGRNQAIDSVASVIAILRQRPGRPMKRKN
jgi:hypothetical protein